MKLQVNRFDGKVVSAITDMGLTFIILAVTTICFMIPRFRADLVSVCMLLALFLTGTLSIQESLAGFSNTAVIMFAALFIVGEGLFQTGLAGKASDQLLKWTRNSELRLMVLMMMLIAVMGSFMSNTGTVAILLPVVISLSVQMNIHPGKLLMPLAFMSSLGGTLTLIGTPPNLIASQTLVEYGFERLSFFSFTPLGVILMVTGGIFLLTIGRKLLQRPADQDQTGQQSESKFDGMELLNFYGTSAFLHTIEIPENSPLAGMTLKQLNWPEEYGLTVLEIKRNEAGEGLFGLAGIPALPRLQGVPARKQLTAGPSTTVQEGDILIVNASSKKLAHFTETTGLEVRGIRENKAGQESVSLNPSQLAEVVLPPQSGLMNRKLAEMGFREQFGLTVLAVKQPEQQPVRPDSETVLRYGDALLVHGKWKRIEQLASQKKDLVVLRHSTQPTETNIKPGRALIAGLILLWMIVMLTFEWLPPVMTTVIAAILMVVTGSIRQTDEAYRAINWQTVVLIAAMLPMATALEKTGGVTFLSENLVSLLGGMGPIAVLGGIYVLTTLLGQFISNTATAVLLFPVAILTSQQLDVSPVPFVMAVAFSASLSFATPISTPPNAMVMAPGRYSFFDFVKVGLPLQVILAVIACALIPVFYPF